LTAFRPNLFYIIHCYYGIAGLFTLLSKVYIDENLYEIKSIARNIEHLIEKQFTRRPLGLWRMKILNNTAFILFLPLYFKLTMLTCHQR